MHIIAAVRNPRIEAPQPTGKLAVLRLSNINVPKRGATPAIKLLDKALLANAEAT